MSRISKQEATVTGPVYALNLFNIADRDEYLAYSRRSAKEVQAHGGRVVALGKFCAPAAALAYSIGGFWDRMRDAPWRKDFQRALVPITVGFIVSGGYVLATPQGPDWPSALIAVASAAALYATRLNPLWILSGGGVLGAALF
ncbi:MAG: hypothetical protein A2W21_13785 [Betaproteobacteria bacterium RBG_16_66_20]|nr:MAG: hypothetical protein A2W21_13785 [Betaproteobacteria bacterium RBG_16_66_20]